MELIYCIIAFGGFANLFEDPTIRATVEELHFGETAEVVPGIVFIADSDHSRSNSSNSG